MSRIPTAAVDRAAWELPRRRFLQGALAMGGAAGLAPAWIDGVVDAGPLPADATVLVAVFLNGGNDALNTLVPDSATYRGVRGELAVDVGAGNAVGEGLYLHPNLGGLKQRFDAGEVALIRGVGEASDDHSHFSSTDRWMTAREFQSNKTGWLGRYMDGSGLSDLGAVSIGYGGSPLALRGATRSPVSLTSNGNLFGSNRVDDWERRAHRGGQRPDRSLRRHRRRHVGQRGEQRIHHQPGPQRRAPRRGLHPGRRGGGSTDQPRRRGPGRAPVDRRLRHPRPPAAPAR